MKALKMTLVLTTVLATTLVITSVLASEKKAEKNPVKLTSFSKQGLKWNSAKILLNELPGETACKGCDDI